MLEICGKSLIARINNCFRLGCLMVLYFLHHLLFRQLCNHWCILEAAIISLAKGQFSNLVGAGALKPLGRKGEKFILLFFIIRYSYSQSFVKLPASQTGHWVYSGSYELTSSVSSQPSWKATEIRYLCRTVPSVQRNILVSFESNHQLSFLEEKQNRTTTKKSPNNP